MKQDMIELIETLQSKQRTTQKIFTSWLNEPRRIMLLFPLLLSVFFFAAFAKLNSNAVEFAGQHLQPAGKTPALNYAALITPDLFSKNLRDTVYTNKDKYLELRIDRQMVYVHYRDGSVKSYPVSSGNKFLSKGVESRPGLFAIFHKEELHLSSQFDDAKMFHYMPFNMGVGFHSLAGTGYYGNLGVRPSSHGCIRMRADDAKNLFKECEIGTLVLAHRGKTARVIAFAPEGFRNEREYTKEDYMKLLAYNLGSVYQGKYFINQPKRFIIDASVIPKIGYNIGDADQISEKQQLPYMVNRFESSDRLEVRSRGRGNENIEPLDPEIASDIAEEDSAEESGLPVDSEMINKYVYNPLGILPYFPPNK